jgi:CRP/FNR family cyclic AMP-dependent transcriptional regulator
MSEANKLSVQKKLRSGELLFKEGDVGEALFIVLKGQIRLFKPKGKGFIEIGLLKSGEILGEMALIEEKGKKGTRSCSAEAIVETDILEVQYDIFNKALDQLNPLYKQMITAFVTRIRTNNQRIKEFESNSLSYNSANDYTFLKDNEILKILSCYYLVSNAFGVKQEDQSLRLNKKMIKMYSGDVFGLPEAKVSSLLEILVNFEIISHDDNPKEDAYYVIIKKPNLLRDIINFYQAERFLADDKRLKIVDTTCNFLEIVYQKILAGAPLEKHRDPAMKIIEITEIVTQYKENNQVINSQYIDDAVKAKLVRDILVDESGKVSLEINLDFIYRYMPILFFQRSIKQLNESKK